MGADMTAIRLDPSPNVVAWCTPSGGAGKTGVRAEGESSHRERQAPRRA
jgi:hypothetical protein